MMPMMIRRGRAKQFLGSPEQGRLSCQCVPYDFTFQPKRQLLILLQAVSSDLHEMLSQCASKTTLVRSLDESPQLSHVNPACHVP